MTWVAEFHYLYCQLVDCGISYGKKSYLIELLFLGDIYDGGGVIKVVRLMDEVESLFIKHFADNDRKKAMKFLRPQQQKDSHMVTFFVGKFYFAHNSPYKLAN